MMEQPDSFQGANASSGGKVGGFGAVGGNVNITADDFLAMMLGNLSTTSSSSLNVLSLLNDTFLGSYGFYNNSSFPYYNGTLLLNGSATGNASLFGGGALGAGSFGGAAGASGEPPLEYPSGYALPHIVFASIVVTILMVIIVVGNMLVIIAIATEKSLKNIQNWFIASLAVSDFFLGLVIMPFSLANELMGYWVFGSWWCDIHSAMDVLLSTASIMNLCLISLDRYWSITKAIEYLKQRTPARAAVMITAVWILSGLICIPPLLGWKVKQPDGPLPQCQLSEDLGYVLYSALGSFYIPSCIMVFVYIRIYFAAKRRARRGIKKVPKKPIAPSEQVTSFSMSPAACKGTRPMPSVPSTSNNSNSNNNNLLKSPSNSNVHPIATIEASSALPPTTTTTTTGTTAAVNHPPTNPIPIVTCDFASDVSNSDACDNVNETSDNIKDTLRVATITRNASSTNTTTNGLQTNGNSNQCNSSSSNNNTPVTYDTLSPAHHGRCRALSVGIDTDMVSEFDPSSSDSGIVSRCANVKPLRFKLFNKSRNSNKKDQQQQQQQQKQKKEQQQKQCRQDSGGHSPRAREVSELEPALPKKERLKDPEKEKRRIARKKEKRATLILGLIMGSFIACWLPFFFLYILTPLCPGCAIPESAFSIAFWLGYMNSALNPVIYTIFNKDFRRAFRRILFK